MSNGLNDGGGSNGGMDPAGRSPDQIQQEIRDTRSQLDSTLDAIQQRLSPSTLTDELVRYVRNGGANEFGHNLNEAVKRNPVPVTLMGIGLTWLMMSGKEGRYAPDRASGGSRLSGMASALGNMASVGREKMSIAAGSMSHTGRSMREQAGQTSSSVREQASQRGSSVREQAGHMGSSMREQAAQVRSSMRDQAGRISESTRHGTQQARSGFESALREQPLLLGLAGIAIGAALGSLLPSTRQEDEWMGDARDRLTDEAKEQARLQLHKGQRIAQSAGQAASDAAEHEAERQRQEPGGADASQQPASGQGAQPTPGL